MPERVGRARGTRVHFDERFFSEDLDRVSAPDAQVARAARLQYETQGVPGSSLHHCDAGARDSTQLPGCLKVYLPPRGFGMVLRLTVKDDRLGLAYLAFGVRHHPPGSHALTVYELAHRRLHGEPPADEGAETS